MALYVPAPAELVIGFGIFLKFSDYIPKQTACEGAMEWIVCLG
jgi:hypothetical protein